MELEQLIKLSGSFEDLKKAIEAEKTPDKEKAELIEQYDLSKHEVNDETKRPNKMVKTDEGTKPVAVARISVPLQKLIVSRAAAFLCGNPVELDATFEEGSVEESLLQVIRKTWDDNKLDYESKKLAKYMMSECECAELWYSEAVDPVYWENTPAAGSLFRLRMKVLAPSLGDTLYPVFSNSGDMVAFGRAYTLLIEGKKRDCFDVYTDQKTIKGVKMDSGWVNTEEVQPTGKIPVIYYAQDAPEWANVQSAIDRMEKMLSNHADSNDYFAFPLMTVAGEVKGMASKGEQGKILELGDNAKVEMITWNQAPESLKLEFNNLRSLIFDMTDTPDISIEQMKSLGTYSGIALKMLFLGAHLKAADKEENFGKSIQRRINYLKAALAKINVKLEKGTVLSIKPRFEYFLPKNDQEKVDILSTAVTAKIVSRETAVALSPLTTDPAAEKDRIDAEANSAGALNEQFS
jgi:SPP1 family phage portal protein